MIRATRAFGAIALGFAAASLAQAGPVVNVQFGDNTTVDYVGTAALPLGTGTVWNLLTGTLGQGSASSGALENSFGGASGVTYATSGTSSSGFINFVTNPLTGYPSDFSNTGAPNLVNSQLGVGPGNTGEILVSGLAAGHPYDIYIYSDRGVTGAYTDFTVTGANGTASLTAGNQSPDTTGFQTPEDYVEFTGFLPNGSNQIEIQFAGVPGGYGSLNGFQLADTTPEPSSLLLLGLGAMGMLWVARRRRA